jgi:hypothetical protein
MKESDDLDREGLERLDDTRLIREYQEMLRAGFDRMFGMNARRRCNACVDELAKRGITEYQGIFGVSQFTKWTY